MLLSERRKRYRQVLEGNACVHPASVFDAMSARIATSLGFEVGMFAGSIGSGTVLGAPDLVVLTLTEFAEQIRRIARGSDLPLMVDADHGYGNALNVMRTVEELETSGVAALTIEDTVLPIPFGGQGEGFNFDGRNAGETACCSGRASRPLPGHSGPHQFLAPWRHCRSGKAPQGVSGHRD